MGAPDRARSRQRRSSDFARAKVGLRSRPDPRARLGALTDRWIGYGSDRGYSIFDDDLEPNEEPFTGVRLVSNRLPDEVILSRAAYRRLVDAILVSAQG